ncbi:hypothetical protein ACCO45_003999 [Purpureocillium lilacinum]|uniref:Uncharacterized protein n=1 Tax=Purpureocillium lilacinum TaxID=33203 RepID=A0ACC4E1H2_PURLI
MDDEQYMIQGMHVHRHWGLARLSCVSNVNHRAPRPPPLLAPRVTDCPWLNATYAESTAACRTNDALSSSHLVVHCLSSVVAVVVVRAFWTSSVLPPLRSMDPLGAQHGDPRRDFCGGGAQAAVFFVAADGTTAVIRRSGRRSPLSRYFLVAACPSPLARESFGIAVQGRRLEARRARGRLSDRSFGSKARGIGPLLAADAGAPVPPLFAVRHSPPEHKTRVPVLPSDEAKRLRVYGLQSV